MKTGEATRLGRRGGPVRVDQIYMKRTMLISSLFYSRTTIFPKGIGKSLRRLTRNDSPCLLNKPLRSRLFTLYSVHSISRTLYCGWRYATVYGVHNYRLPFVMTSVMYTCYIYLDYQKCQGSPNSSKASVRVMNMIYNRIERS